VAPIFEPAPADIPDPSRRLARHTVRDHIVQMVLTQQYAPGKKLVQQTLAKQLGVSRSVVREAIMELQGMGLVDVQDNRGGRVSPECRRFLMEGLELREAFERLAVRRCCDRITRTQLQELIATAHEIHRLGAADLKKEAGILNRKFHLRLMEISDNRLQIRMSQNFWFATKLTSSARPDADRILAEHLAILTAIERGDADAAEKAAVDHVRWARQLTEEGLNGPESHLYWLVNPLEEAVRSSGIVGDASLE
jgi:DNA-binding GntR family transcriptional regulator